MNDGLIDCIILPKSRSADDEEDYRNIRNTAIMNDVEIKYFTRGNEIYLDGENGGVKNLCNFAVRFRRLGTKITSRWF
ncbi:MAG: hypothetical protein L6V93_06540 [Clostridiales bacterium]|nr:MAG: hypothetical protein L6V93_06540 [Clostridiales bacterium]